MEKILRAHELRNKLDKEISNRSAYRNPNCLTHENFQWDMETWRQKFRVEGIYVALSQIVEPLLSVADMFADDETNKMLNTLYARLQDDLLSGKIG